MSGGSSTREHPSDVQCPECGEYYQQRGLVTHLMWSEDYPPSTARKTAFEAAESTDQDQEGPPQGTPPEGGQGGQVQESTPPPEGGGEGSPIHDGPNPESRRVQDAGSGSGMVAGSKVGEVADDPCPQCGSDVVYIDAERDDVDAVCTGCAAPLEHKEGS